MSFCLFRRESLETVYSKMLRYGLKDSGNQAVMLYVGDT